MLTNQIRTILERNLTNIGTLPTIISSLMRILNDPRSSTRDLAKVITADQVLSSKLLRLVNSSYFGLRKEVIDVQQAVGLVGFNVIRTFMFCISLFDNPFPAGSGLVFDNEKFWIHSIAVGVLAQKIAEKLHLENSKDFFVAGLVHDIGKILMIQFLPLTFYKVLEEAVGEKMSFYHAEKRLLGTDHSEIGAWTMKKWRIPEMLIRCIHFHHLAIINDGKVRPTEIIALADNIAKKSKIGFSGDKITSREYDKQKWKYNVSQQWIDGAYSDVIDKMGTYADIIVKRKTIILTK